MPGEPDTPVLDGPSEDAIRVPIISLRIFEPRRAPRQVKVGNASIRIGTHDRNDVVLHDESASRLHCEIVADGAQFRLRDLESTNGTYVQGMRVYDVVLPPRCTMTIGRTRLEFDVLDEVATLSLASRARFGPLVGKSVVMRDLFSKLERVAATDATVLIQGESGTGKELIAEALHGASHRRGGPFVVFDCTTVPANLLESELFGHESGAFTGATARRSGCLEEADGGTLFFDEVGELPLDLQAKLLRAVEKREVRPVGAARARRFDVRIVAATNRDLAREVNRGSFREDLYYRLAVVRLRAPPLRERSEDIPLLVEHLVHGLLRRDRSRAERVLASISVDNWNRLARYPWRGNVRELRSTIERSLALSADMVPEAIDPASVSTGAGGSSTARPAEAASPDRVLTIEWDVDRGLIEQRKAIVAEFERTYLTHVLALNDGNFSRAAEQAGLDRMYFKRLLKKHQ